MDEEILIRVEEQRLELEANIARLRKNLRYWQTLEIDYEGLKEEFQGLPEDASHDECLQAAQDFKPELVNHKEIHALFESRQTGRKKPSQLVDLLSKRVDYVSKNISTIRKQLSEGEKKRNALLLAQYPEHQDEAGLPLTEITEELDGEGKVISSKIQTPGQEAHDLLDVLEKAGVSDLKDGKPESGQTELGNKADSEKSGSGGKAFSANAVSMDTSQLNDNNRIQEISDDEDNDPNTDDLGPKNPNDTEDDAALRQEMLQYGLGEVGTIVAQLDLEDLGDQSYDDDDNEDDYLSDYDEDEDLYQDESEDERGATKNPVLSARYKRQMEALSKKHGITDLTNLGPQTDTPNDAEGQSDRPPPAEAARQAAIARDEANKSALKPSSKEENSADEPKKKRKTVAFAQSLDIAEEVPKKEVVPPAEPAIHPVGDFVVERTDEKASQSTAPPTTPPSTKKVSRFKAARAAEPQTPMFPPPMQFPSSTTSNPTPEGPSGRTISTNLVERPASKITAPADPIDFDEAIHRREVAIEYQKMRNRKIHEQGGYVKGGEAENYGEELAPETVIDENTGKPRKISRFKAARMKNQS